MGGVGKTSLANALMHNYKNRFQHLIWLDTKIGVKEAFVNNIQLVDNLGITSEIQQLNNGSTEAINKSYNFILNRLRTLEKYGLLVLDDADEKLETLAPALSLKENWKILVTSRSVLDGFEVYKLGFLNLQSAINLFLYYSKIDRTSEYLVVVEEIVSSVWHHTLTIELLAKTIHENNAFDIYALKAKLEQGGIKAVPEHDIKTFYIHEKVDLDTVTTTTKACLKIAFSIYEFRRQLLLEKILIYFSVLPPVPIEYNTIEKLFGISDTNMVDFNNGLKKLVSKSWLIRSSHGYHMHPVIQEIIRDSVEVSPETTTHLIVFLNEISKSFKHVKSVNLLLYSTYIKNILSVFEKEKSSMIADLAYNYAVLLRNIGKPRDALKYHLIAKEYREIYQPNSASLAEVLCGIAAIKINLGELDEAESLMLQTLRLQKQNLNPANYNIAISHHNLAVIYKKRFEKDPSFLQIAYNEEQAAIDILINDVDHQEELSTAYILKGQLQKHEKKYNEAKETLLKALTIRSRIFGEEHYMTVRVYEEMSLISKIEENWDEGYMLLSKVMPVINNHFEKDSLNLAMPYHNYAFFLFKKGLRDKALEEQKKSINIFEQHFGPENPSLNKAKQQLDFFMGN